MRSRANIAGHPIHPMLVVFPIGLWVSSFLCDIVFLSGGDPLWRTMAFYAMAGGIIGAIAAAIPGAIDLFSMTDRNTQRIGIVHMSINLSLVVLFLINSWWRIAAAPDDLGPVWLSGISIAFLLVSGWLGGEMVYVRGAGVSPRAEAPATEEGEPIPIHRERRRPTTVPYTGPERRRQA